MRPSVDPRRVVASIIARTSQLAFLALTVALAGCSTVPPLPMASSEESKATSGLVLRWLGTSTVTISDGRSTVMVDAFLSRTGKSESVLATMGLPVISPNDSALDRLVRDRVLGRVDAIFVAHSHHDHVLDVARVARRTGSVIHGSTSAKRVVEGDIEGLPFEVVENGAGRCVGQFNVKVIASPHRSSVVAPAGEVSPSFSMPSKMSSFRAGESFAFLLEHPLGTVLIIPSAVMSPALPPDYPAADVVLLGAGLMGRDTREGMKTYWKAAVSDRTRRVHPIHWDDFTRSLTRELRPLPFSRMRDAVEAMTDFAGAGLELSYLPLLNPVTLPRYATAVGHDTPCNTSLSPKD